MREIKVRCWDDESEEMIYSGKKDDIHFFEFNDKGILKCFRGIDIINSEGFPEGDVEELNNDPELFTGFPDKSGKEIYVGDIVILKGHEVRAGKQIRPERKIIVDWDIQELYRLKNIINAGYLEPEIIGNRHENPEML